MNNMRPHIFIDTDMAFYDVSNPGVVEYVQLVEERMAEFQSARDTGDSQLVFNAFKSLQDAEKVLETAVIEHDAITERLSFWEHIYKVCQPDHYAKAR